MTHARAVVLTVIVLAGSIAHGAPAVKPGPARVELAVRKPTHFLGENVLVDYCVVNTGTAPITIEVGGDYRGSSRSLRFKLAVTDGKGAAQPDPDPVPMNFGGLGYSPAIQPGKKWCQTLQLMRYARIDAPGTYTITATHDLGWPAGTAPTGKLAVKLAMPTAAEAEKVIAAMEKLKANDGVSAGEPTPDFPDFTTLRYEVYVAPLLARAQRGVVHALDGLAQIPTPSATRALVGLLGHADRDLAHAAIEALALRLPDPALAGKLPKRNVFANELTEQRKYLSQSWVPALADAVRAEARKRLASSVERDQIDGAFMVEAVGTLAEAPDVTRALDLSIERTKTQPAETNLYPPPRGANQELLRAAEMLVARGHAPTSPKSPGEIAMWLAALGQGQRPAGWDADLATALGHAIPYVRELGLVRAPDTLPPALVTLVRNNLAHRDADVRVAAAELAARAKLTALAPDVVKAMKGLDHMRLNSVGYAATRLGAKLERARMLVTLLDDPATFDEALSGLVDVLEYQGRSANGEVPEAIRTSLAVRWKAFVEAHKAEITAGKRISLDDPSVTTDLVPPQWKLGRGNGKEWP